MVSWVRETEDGAPMAWFRIAVAAIILVRVVPPVLFGSAEALWLDASVGGLTALKSTGWLWQGWGPWPGLGTPNLTTVSAVWLTTVASALWLGVGWHARLAALVALQGVIGMVGIHPGTGGGYDPLLCSALWFLVLARSDATWSLAAWRGTGRWTPSVRIPAWPRFLVLVQLAFMYTLTGIQKVDLAWTFAGGYDAVYLALSTPSWQRFDPGSLYEWLRPILRVSTFVTGWFETLAGAVFIGAWWADRNGRSGRWQRARRAFVAVGVVLHLSLFVCMDLGPFPWITLAYYIALWPSGTLDRQ